MPGIVEFPKLVQDALAQFGDLFANECQGSKVKPSVPWGEISLLTTAWR
jgi:hypothetical protein